MEGGELPLADGAASLQEAVADVLTRKAVAACRDHGCPRWSWSAGWPPTRVEYAALHPVARGAVRAF